MLEKSMFNIRQIFTSIADVGQKIFRRKELKKLKKLDSILTLSDDLLSNKGAAFGITVARDITDLYQILSNEDKLGGLPIIPPLTVLPKTNIGAAAP